MTDAGQLGQHLTGFALALGDVRRRVASGDSVEARLDQMEELARLMTRDARRLGLAGIRERAALLGGTVDIESSPGAGTTLKVRLPVEPRSPDGPPEIS